MAQWFAKQIVRREGSWDGSFPGHETQPPESRQGSGQQESPPPTVVAAASHLTIPYPRPRQFLASHSARPVCGLPLTSHILGSAIALSTTLKGEPEQSKRAICLIPPGAGIPLPLWEKGRITDLIQLMNEVAELGCVAPVQTPCTQVHTATFLKMLLYVKVSKTLVPNN